jgi:hypothetical protein
MKKIIALVIALVLSLSLCACSNTYTNKNGETMTVQSGDVVFDITDEFTVTKIDKSVYHVDSFGARKEYTAVLQNDEYTMVIIVSAEQYALWSIGDVVSGNLKSKYHNSYTDIISEFKLADDTLFSVEWYGLTE